MTDILLLLVMQQQTADLRHVCRVEHHDPADVPARPPEHPLLHRPQVSPHLIRTYYCTIAVWKNCIECDRHVFTTCDPHVLFRFNTRLPTREVNFLQVRYMRDHSDTCGHRVSHM